MPSLSRAACRILVIRGLKTKIRQAGGFRFLQTDFTFDDPAIRGGAHTQIHLLDTARCDRSRGSIGSPYLTTLLSKDSGR
jgi:hypothetical protein